MKDVENESAKQAGSRTRPPAVRQILTCLQRQHCWGGDGGCEYKHHCDGGPAERLDIAALMSYIERLEVGMEVRNQMTVGRSASRFMQFVPCSIPEGSILLNRDHIVAVTYEWSSEKQAEYTAVHMVNGEVFELLESWGDVVADLAETSRGR